MSSLMGPPEPETPLASLHSRQAQEKPPGLGLGWKIGPPAASLFDALATRDAINRGGTEANPVLAPFAENDAALIATKVGTGVLAAILADRLHRAGHPNMARVVSGLNIVIPAAAGTHNALSGRDR